MSGVVGKNEDRYSGQIATVVGIETVAVDKDPNLVAKWVMEPNAIVRQYELGAGFGTSGSSAVTTSGGSGGTAAYIFDGTSWAATGSISFYRQSGGGVGSASAGYMVGGSADAGLQSSSAEFDGTSWAAGGSIPAARNYNTGGAGTQTAGLFWGGAASTNAVNNSYLYDGTSWASTGNLATAVLGSPGCGTTSAGLSIGGNTGHINSDNQVQTVQEFGGSTWSAGGSILQRRAWGTPAGIQTAAHTTSGEGAYPVQYYSNSETYDGTSWTTADPSIVPRYRGGSAQGGSTNNFMIFQGAPGPHNYCCSFISPSEVTAAEGTVWYNTTDRQLKVATMGTGANGTWASGGAVNTAMNAFGASGYYNSAMKYGGNSGSVSGVSESYDGSTWTAESNILTARRSLAGAGNSATSALSFGGDTSINESGVTNKTEIWDGSSWQQGENMTLNRARHGGAGGVYSAIRIDGYQDSGQGNQNDAEVYNGVAWLRIANPSARTWTSAAGNPSAALLVGGYSGGATASCQEYDSMSWNSAGSLNNSMYGGATDGTQTAAMFAGGFVGGSDWSNKSEEYNGTAWTSMSNLSTGRSDLKGAGTSQNLLAPSGYSSSGTRTTTTEEFTKNLTAVILNKMGVPRHT